jgi:hypothetical protein
MTGGLSSSERFMRPADLLEKDARPPCRSIVYNTAEGPANGLNPGCPPAEPSPCSTWPRTEKSSPSPPSMP